MSEKPKLLDAYEAYSMFKMSPSNEYHISYGQAKYEKQIRQKCAQRAY